MAISQYEGYFEQDEESVEAPGVEDPLWEQQQKKTFTAWCNSQLRKRGASIEHIDVDFRDGLLLIKLIEVISGEDLPKPDKGKMRVHKIANVNKALKFIASKGVNLVMISAEEIVDGNVKLTLGMIWTIILRFAIQDIQIEDLSAKDGLLAWCRNKTKPYNNVNITNFNTSFKDGLAFCALIHRHRPDLIDYDKLTKDNPRHNLNLAFDIAEHHLDIPRMLDPEDMISSAKPDDRSTMAYVSSYYHCLTGSDKASIAANRIADVLKANREVARLQKEYELNSDDLLAWMKKNLARFSDRTSPADVASAENLLHDCKEYNIHERPDKLREKAKLEVTYNKIQTYLRLSQRPPYVPEIGKQLANIAEQWAALDKAFNDYKDFLILELQCRRRADYLLRKLNLRCTTHEAWASGQPEALKRTDYLSANLPELRAMLKRHEAFLPHLVANADRAERIHAIVNELANLGYHDMPTVNKRYEAIVRSMEEIERLASAREQKLKELLPVMEQIDQLHLEFAKRAAPFKNWAEHTAEDLRDMPNFYNMADVEDSFEAHVHFEQSLGETELQRQGIENLAIEVQKLAATHHLIGVESNPYTNIKPGEVTECMQNVETLTKERTKVLSMEKQKQMDNEKLRQDFVQKGMAFDRALQDKMADITSHTVGGKGSLEQQLENLKKLETELLKLKPQLDELEHCSQVLDSAFRAGESDTTLSMPTLHISWEQCVSTLSEAINLVENRILTRDSKGLTAEQMNELQNSFRQFDHNKSGHLDAQEFKACLLSVGHSFSTGRKESAAAVISEQEFAKIMKIADPENKGYVTFNAFVDYMTRDNTADNAKDQIVQSFTSIAGEKGYLTAQDIDRYLPPEDAAFCKTHMVPLTGPFGDAGGLNYKKFAEDFHTSPRFAA